MKIQLNLIVEIYFQILKKNFSCNKFKGWDQWEIIRAIIYDERDCLIEQLVLLSLLIYVLRRNASRVISTSQSNSRWWTFFYILRKQTYREVKLKIIMLPKIYKKKVNMKAVETLQDLFKVVSKEIFRELHQISCRKTQQSIVIQ